MPTRISVGSSQRKDFEIVCSIEPSRLAEIVEALSEIDQQLVSPTELRRILEDKLDREQAHALARRLFTFSAYMRQENVSVDEALVDLTETLAEKWESNRIDAWRAIAPKLKEILSLDTFDVVTKVISLSYEYANILSRSQLLTDIRPVFDANRERIVSAVISQTLRLRYMSENGQRSISLALDENDIKSLKKSCDYALQKADKAKEMLAERCGLRAFKVGEGDNG